MAATLVNVNVVAVWARAPLGVQVPLALGSQLAAAGFRSGGLTIPLQM